jgi:nitroimidazol reductase NimA-like FMN-containing flavoprotein (pyridoxamine 5'-phosphate oxidase superfamily)
MAQLELQPTLRTRVRRRAGRGRYDRATIDAILDEGMVGHLGVVTTGQPYVIPVLYARDGEWVYMHGSPLSRLLGAAAEGVPLCLTVTLVDGLVLARSAFHHSVNYRSVVVLGEATAVVDHGAKHTALRRIVEHVAPGRSDEVRGPSAAELDATEVVAMPLREASAKIRTGPPVDASEDYTLPVWAGQLPLGLAVGAPVPDDRCAAPIPDYVSAWQRGRRGDA